MQKRTTKNSTIDTPLWTHLFVVFYLSDSNAYNYNRKNRITWTEKVYTRRNDTTGLKLESVKVSKPLQKQLEIMKNDHCGTVGEKWYKRMTLKKIKKKMTKSKNKNNNCQKLSSKRLSMLPITVAKLLPTAASSRFSQHEYYRDLLQDYLHQEFIQNKKESIHMTKIPPHNSPSSLLLSSRSRLNTDKDTPADCYYFTYLHKFVIVIEFPEKCKNLFLYTRILMLQQYHYQQQEHEQQQCTNLIDDGEDINNMISINDYDDDDDDKTIVTSNRTIDKTVLKITKNDTTTMSGVMKRALEMNYLTQETFGCTLGFTKGNNSNNYEDPSSSTTTTELILSYYHQIIGLEPEELYTIITNFMNSTRFVHEELIRSSYCCCSDSLQSSSSFSSSSSLSPSCLTDTSQYSSFPHRHREDKIQTGRIKTLNVSKLKNVKSSTSNILQQYKLPYSSYDGLSNNDLIMLNRIFPYGSHQIQVPPPPPPPPPPLPPLRPIITKRKIATSLMKTITMSQNTTITNETIHKSTTTMNDDSVKNTNFKLKETSTNDDINFIPIYYVDNDNHDNIYPRIEDCNDIFTTTTKSNDHCNGTDNSCEMRTQTKMTTAVAWEEVQTETMMLTTTATSATATITSSTTKTTRTTTKTSQNHRNCQKLLNEEEEEEQQQQQQKQSSTYGTLAGFEDDHNENYNHLQLIEEQPTMII